MTAKENKRPVDEPTTLQRRDIANLRDLADVLTELLHITIRVQSVRDDRQAERLRLEIDEQLGKLDVISELAILEWERSGYAALPVALRKPARTISTVAITIRTRRDAFEIDLSGPLVLEIKSILMGTREMCEAVLNYAGRPSDDVGRKDDHADDEMSSTPGPNPATKKPPKPPTKTERDRDQRIKFCCPKRIKKSQDTWNEIYDAYHKKYPNDKKASPGSLRQSHDRYCPKRPKCLSEKKRS